MTRKEVVARKLTESALAVSEETRDEYLYYILQRHTEHTMVFCNSIANLRRLAALLRILVSNITTFCYNITAFYCNITPFYCIITGF